MQLTQESRVHWCVCSTAQGRGCVCGVHSATLQCSHTPFTNNYFSHYHPVGNEGEWVTGDHIATEQRLNGGGHLTVVIPPLKTTDQTPLAAIWSNLNQWTQSQKCMHAIEWELNIHSVCRYIQWHGKYVRFRY